MPDGHTLTKRWDGWLISYAPTGPIPAQSGGYRCNTFYCPYPRADASLHPMHMHEREVEVVRWRRPARIARGETAPSTSEGRRAYAATNRVLADDLAVLSGCGIRRPLPSVPDAGMQGPADSEVEAGAAAAQA
jgi:hypothetical protein